MFNFEKGRGWCVRKWHFLDITRVDYELGVKPKKKKLESTQLEFLDNGTIVITDYKMAGGGGGNHRLSSFSLRRISRIFK